MAILVQLVAMFTLGFASLLLVGTSARGDGEQKDGNLRGIEDSMPQGGEDGSI